ncbi:NAD(+) diphosphatase [Bifidobacterium sp. SMB2]|uniref:NAD(+) diphosphatase n=1 Tax=Bifidobacterium saimiriisciurei TaxID=2661627 RepID=A0ABX0CFA1_9BIFI|nr:MULTISPECIES: NAD(+) diphosphatase [Bifidobacterium]NEG95236.1 NAD(+) diphosphatase [Bifidobacterium sp. SMB2]NEH11313.1 NAD(+) diphosphatase [Bifidobacterium saimiriisciurei]
MTDSIDPVFSPLALTQALPFLPLAQGTIDYEVDRRGEEGLIDTVLGETATQVMLISNGLIAVPKGDAAKVEYDVAKIRPALVPGPYVRAELRAHRGVTAIFLGTDRLGAAPETHYVALDITRAASDIPGSQFGADHTFGRDDDSLIGKAAARFDWVDLRGFAPHVGSRDAGLATSAVTVGIWHNRQRFCPCCGSPVEPALAGWAQRCTNASDGNRILFPRIEPAVITAIVDSSDRLLLQHNAAWKDNLYSVSAGFVEAGENLEHAARREAKEETGITLGEVKYLGSQPWPFPASLMMAFKARALTTEVRVDHEETADARWFTRDEFTDAMIMGRIKVPGKATIARYMLEEWYGRPLQ